MVFNAFFNNISVRSWQSFSLVEETGASVENNRIAASHQQQTLSQTSHHSRNQTHNCNSDEYR
jgi:hypothetical protein